jgi:hypothetical protein
MKRMDTALADPCPGCGRRIYYANFAEAMLAGARDAREKGYKRIYGLDRGVSLRKADALWVSTCITTGDVACPACGASLTKQVEIEVDEKCSKCGRPADGSYYRYNDKRDRLFRTCKACEMGGLSP